MMEVLQRFLRIRTVKRFAKNDSQLEQKPPLDPNLSEKMRIPLVTSGFQQPGPISPFVYKMKSSRESIRVQYLEDVQHVEKMKCFLPVTTLACLNIEMLWKSKTMSISLAVPYCTPGWFKKRKLTIEKSLIFNNIVVIVLLRTLSQKRLCYSIQRIS